MILPINLAFRTHGRWQNLISILCLFVLSAPVFLVNLSTYPPPWFDEGYRLNAARTLVDRGIFGTYTSNGLLPFDPGMSSGPVEIGLVALSFHVLGEGILQARLIIVFFSLFALATVYLLGRQLYGARAAWFVSLFVLIMPPIGNINFVLIGRQVISEMPSLALILAGFLLWFTSWESRRIWIGLLAGLVMGLGLLSKTQVGIALIPAAGIISLARWRLRRSSFATSFVALAGILGVLFGWALVTRLGTPTTLLTQNQANLVDAIQTNLITDLHGSNLGRSGIAIGILMALASGSVGWRLVTDHLGSQKSWAEATLGLFVLVYATWFVGLSIGWPRYAFVGLIAALFLVAKLAWDLLQKALRKVPFPKRLEAVVLACLAAGVLLSGLVTVSQPYQPDAQAMGDYIRQNIPPQAVIESWEWELDVLSGRWQFHHPDQKYLFQAIRVQSHQEPAFDLGYDLLQANPSFLVLGPFSQYTQIYDPSTVSRNFTLMIGFGPYQLYRRNQPQAFQ